MGDNVDVKKSKQGQNTTYFDPNRFWSQFWKPSRENVSYRAECIFMFSRSVGFAWPVENSFTASRVTFL
jgi:hypothetical protein